MRIPKGESGLRLANRIADRRSLRAQHSRRAQRFITVKATEARRHGDSLPFPLSLVPFVPCPLLFVPCPVSPVPVLDPIDLDFPHVIVDIEAARPYAAVAHAKRDLVTAGCLRRPLVRPQAPCR